MTRNSEINGEDILGCTHEPETPVMTADGMAIDYWLCRCGRRHRVRAEPAPPEREKKP
jgi:hypothetical protein